MEFPCFNNLRKDSDKYYSTKQMQQYLLRLIKYY